mmetsp:Transcript_61105/g.126152  ORF Transcript_61105/g.126152 Transcript_61105/m.126152 type:complete len:592 (-) Transcript_61105:957-2732(-)
MSTAVSTVDAEVKSTVKSVAVSVDSAALVVVGSVLRKEALDLIEDNASAGCLVAGGVHDVHSDHVLELEEVPSRAGVGKVLSCALDHERHEGCLDTVRRNLGRVLGAHSAVSNVLEDGEAQQLRGGGGSADDERRDGHVFEVGFGRDSITEQVDAPIHDGDRGSEGRLHLLRGVAVVRGARDDAGGIVHGADYHVYKHVHRQVRAGIRLVETQVVNPERDVEGHELIGQIRSQERALAHGGSGSAGLCQAGLESRLLCKVSVAGEVGVRSGGGEILRGSGTLGPLRAAVIHGDLAHEVTLASADGGQRDEALVFVRAVLGAKGEGDLHINGRVGSVGEEHVAGGLARRLVRSVRVLIQDGNETQVHVLEERVIVRAVRGHREEARLLHVKRRLRRHGVHRLEARGPEIDVAEERVHRVLHRSSALHLAGQLTKIELLNLNDRLVLEEERILKRGVDNSGRPGQTLESSIQEIFGSRRERHLRSGAILGFVVVGPINSLVIVIIESRPCPGYKVLGGPVVCDELVKFVRAAVGLDGEVDRIEAPVVRQGSVVEIVGQGVVAHHVREVERVESLIPTRGVGHANHPAAGSASR